MQSEKLRNIELFTGVHTLSIRTNCQAMYLPDSNPAITELPRHKSDDNIYYYYKLNLNKLVGREIWTKESFNEILRSTLHDIGIEQDDFVFHRVDFRVDQTSCTYEDQWKLHLALISLVSFSYKLENFWLSEKPLDLTKLTIRSQGSRYQVENYNKAAEHPGYPAKNRFEMRSIRLNTNNDPADELVLWVKRLRRALKQYDNLLAHCNKVLLLNWEKENGTKRTKTLSEFLRKYERLIFSNKQLVSFMSEIGKQNPKTSAHNFKSKNNIEFITLKNLNCYIDKIEEAVNAYISGTQTGFQTVPAMSLLCSKKEYFCLDENAQKTA